MKETWKDIKDWEGIYQVSNRGHVKRIRKGRGAVPGRILRAGNVQGYRHVVLYDRARHSDKGVHQLVAAAFIGPRPSPTHDVNHKDGNRANNQVSNLEWCTRSENHKHAYRVLGKAVTIPRLKGAQAPGAKLSQEDVARIRKVYALGKVTYVVLAQEYGVHYSTIGYIVRGDTFPSVAALNA